MMCKEAPELLCLSKRDGVYVKCGKLEQHHVDGIRFTYRQFKQKTPGVIINAGGRSRRLQIVLFLQGVVRQMAERPAVLVMCESGTEAEWLAAFHAHTDFGNEVVIETSKVFTKKTIVISPLENCSRLADRHWRLVVVDADSPHCCLLQYSFSTDFKIWGSAANMKRNLETFKSIYEWMYPKHRFNCAEFMADVSSVADVVDKAVLLDAFMADIVVRRRDLDGDVMEDEVALEPPKPVTRKNKDATGTKIKRSKPKIQDATMSDKVEAQTTSATKIVELKDIDKANSSTIADDTASQENEMKLQLEPDSVPKDDVPYEFTAQVDDKAVKELEAVKLNYDNIKNRIRMIELDSDEPLTKKRKLGDSSSKTVSHISENKTKSTDPKQYQTIGDFNVFKRKAEVLAPDSDTVVSETKVDVAAVTIPESETAESMEIGTIEDNELKDGNSEIGETAKQDVATTKDVQEGHKNGSNATADKSESQLFTNVSDKSKVEDLEDKNKECVEQALKRFKGTVFDNLF